jgi:hypothetical protein
MFEYKSFDFEIKAQEDGVFEGYASMFNNLDSYRDIVVKGAFNRTINNNSNRVKVLWQHDISEPIGKPIMMAEDEKGLHVKAKLCLGTEKGRQCFELMKDGVINELSIGHDTIQDEYDSKNRIRYLKEVRLWEFSAVTFAANDMAKVNNVKRFDRLLDELKSGRVLSSTNRSRIQETIDALMALLIETDPERSTQTLEDPPKNSDIDPDTVHSILEAIKQYK